MKKIYIPAVLSAVVFTLSLSLSACGSESTRIKRMQKLEEGVQNPNTIEELEDAIKKYDQRAADLVLTEGQMGIWYKILGTRYIDEKMYGKALECFKKAIEYYPDNANLFYYQATCSAFLGDNAKAVNSQGEAQKYFQQSESSFKRCLQLDPKQYRAMYSIGILYVFALEQYQDAVPYLQDYLAVQTKDTDGMFLLARAYFGLGEFEKAIELYDRIIKINPNPQKVQDAKNNKQAALDAE